MPSIATRWFPSSARLLLAAGALCLLATPGCVHVKIAPLEVNAKVQMDVTLKADRVVEEYLGELNRRRAELLGQQP